MTDFIVRRGLPGDLERAGQLGGGLARLHHDRDPDRFFLPEQVEQGYAWWFGKELTRQSAVLLVALQGEALVGYAYGALEDRDWNLLLDRHGVIHDIFVVEAARRLGAGAQLLDAMVRELEALGAPRIVLYTMVSNENAQRLFRSRGFRSTMLEMMRSSSDRDPPGSENGGARTSKP
jgi:ribosomal protein S18 acetylase RimI-like enzyme